MTTIDITMMCLPNFHLNKLRFDQTPEGKAARKELQRRKLVGFYIECDEEKAEFVKEQEEAARRKAEEEVMPSAIRECV